MKVLLKLEEFAILLAAVYIYSLLGYSWWLFAALLLTPDLGILGYIINSKTGAFTYNILHHKGIAIVLYFAGLFANLPILMLIGVIILAHSALDRVFGYGLKYADNFKNTHLGRIGKA